MADFVLYLRLFQYGFRRHSTYLAAALAGAFTNTVFGVLRAYVLIALWEARPGLAGYTLTEAVTFCFLTQGFIGPMQVFGRGLSFGDRIRSGDIAFDLVRPAPLLLWSLSEDLGRAAYLTLARSLPPSIAGAVMFTMIGPVSPWFAVSFVLGVVVSFGWRYLVTLTACWTTDDRGVHTLSSLLTFFFSGMVLPLGLFPGWLRTVAEASPFAAMVQVPADVWLGAEPAWSALGFQLFWVVALLGLGALATSAARRKVVVQGG
ncbi:ABC transporter permease [Herbidospora sp. NEAU-GS84]|uniref:ABC transporter permease n=1 Tax=Herbidospora solisilvae TaxID=2696284 RepID=A0A7C9MUN0_9ACTN|nr:MULTISPECIES: ABC-2 family transporter protein [Herbidospora]NAS20671.1 ABC transporter permease [Herbidospora solisilvae]GLX93296.1 ABC transporter permease [Herbidospora sp. NBRC 101105]